MRGLAEQVLEVVHVAERVEQSRHLAHREWVVAAEVHRALPRKVRERLLEVAGQLIDLPAQVHVLEEALGETLELGALLGRHRVHELLHLGHRLGHLLEQLVEGLRVPGEEVAVALHEPLEVGLLAPLALLEHLVELGEHVLHALHALRAHVLHAFGHLVEVALHQLLAQLVHELLEALARAVVHPVVLLELLDLAREVGRELVELLAALLGQVVDDLLTPAVTRLQRLVDPSLDALALLIRDLAQLLGDLLVHAAEVVVLEHLAPALAQPLQHVAQAHELFAVAVFHALLHEATQRRVEVAVVQQVVGHLVEQRIGVEVEPALRAVPRRVAKPALVALPPPSLQHRTERTPDVSDPGLRTGFGDLLELGEGLLDALVERGRRLGRPDEQLREEPVLLGLPRLGHVGAATSGSECVAPARDGLLCGADDELERLARLGRDHGALRGPAERTSLVVPLEPGARDRAGRPADPLRLLRLRAP